MTPEELHRVSTGFMGAKIALAAAETGLFEIVAGGEGLTAEDAARRAETDPRATEIVLDALVALGMVEKSAGRYRLAAELEPELREDSPSQMVAMLRHRNRMFREWSRLEERLRPHGSAPGSDRELLHDPRANRDFIRAMLWASRALAPAVVDGIDLAGVRRAADLGGGPGHYAVEIASRGDAIEVWLVDLPRTLETSQELAPLLGATRDRIHVEAWDFYEEPVPSRLPTFDLILVSQVLHAESPERNRRLLGTIAKLLEPRGRLFVHEFFVDPGRTSPSEAALFAVNMLAMTSGGRTYTVEEVGAWAREAGLEAIGFASIHGRTGLASFAKA